MAYILAFLFVPSFLLHHFSVIDLFGGMLVIGMSGIVILAFYKSVAKPESYQAFTEDESDGA